jgi:hypothetical protein
VVELILAMVAVMVAEFPLRLYLEAVLAVIAIMAEMVLLIPLMEIQVLVALGVLEAYI